MTYKEVIKRMEAVGWTFVRMGNGGHMLFKRPGDPRPIVVAGGGKLNRDVPTGTLNALFRQAGLK